MKNELGGFFPDGAYISHEARRHIKLDTLVRLRWVAVAGQSVAVVVVAFLMDFPTPIAPCFVLIALSAWLNLILRIRFPANTRLKNAHAAALLSWDIIQLAGLLYLTGGVQNPFVFLFLVPVIISASALPMVWTMVLAAEVVIFSSLLSVYFTPLPWFENAPLLLPGLYRFAIWISLISSLAFAIIYAWRIARESRLMSDALSATELVLAREQKISALDGLAAAAAHELGTPLGTISLVAKELLLTTPKDDPRREDLELLKTQADRCRTILGKLTSMSAEGDAQLARMSVEQLIEELTAPFSGSKVQIDKLIEGGKHAPSLPRNPAILYGLGNILENAIDFAFTRVTITARWKDDVLKLSIEDNGPGFAADVLERLGEPYLTSRAIHARADKVGSGGGLGLGFFIAKTFLERSGAKLNIVSKKEPSGALIEVIWPREELIG